MPGLLSGVITARPPLESRAVLAFSDTIRAGAAPVRLRTFGKLACAALIAGTVVYLLAQHLAEMDAASFWSAIAAIPVSALALSAGLSALSLYAVSQYDTLALAQLGPRGAASESHHWRLYGGGDWPDHRVRHRDWQLCALAGLQAAWARGNRCGACNGSRCRGLHRRLCDCPRASLGLSMDLGWPFFFPAQSSGSGWPPD